MSWVDEAINEIPEDAPVPEIPPVPSTASDTLTQIEEAERRGEIAPIRRFVPSEGDPTRAVPEARFLCNKCGYVGASSHHGNCDYLALPMPKVDPILGQVFALQSEKISRLTRERDEAREVGTISYERAEFAEGIVRESWKRLNGYCESIAVHGDQPDEELLSLLKYLRGSRV